MVQLKKMIVKSTGNIITLNTQIQNMADQIERDNAEIDAITEELVKDAARAAMVQDAAAKKQRGLIAITAAITMGYSGNKGKISLRRLAKARHSSDEAQVQRAKELMGKTSAVMPLTNKKQVQTADATLFARSLAAAIFTQKSLGNTTEPLTNTKTARRRPRRQRWIHFTSTCNQGR